MEVLHGSMFGSDSSQYFARKRLVKSTPPRIKETFLKLPSCNFALDFQPSHFQVNNLNYKSTLISSQNSRFHDELENFESGFHCCCCRLRFCERFAAKEKRIQHGCRMQGKKKIIRWQ